MVRPVIPALEINDQTRGWTCIIQVLERHPALLNKLDYYPFQKRYQNFLLTDMQGTKVQAILFDKDIDFFERSLKPFNRYKISNARVVKQREQWRQLGYEYTWYIKSKTPVELIDDERIFTIPCTFDVCAFRDLHKFAESDTNIAIKALVVHAFRTGDIDETNASKDYVVVNEEGIPMVLRLWQDLLADYDPAINNYRNRPVTIIASNLEVKTFHGLSLATRKNTYIIEDPPLAETMEPKIWYNQNKAMVDEWIKTKAYENNTKFFPTPAEEEILDMNGAMEALKTQKPCWIKSKVYVPESRFPPYEVLCANCRLILDAGVDWKLKCAGCMVYSPMEVRYNIPVNLTDGENNIRSAIKSPDAEKLAKISAAEFKRQTDEGLSPIDDLRIAMDYTEVVTFVKHYDKVIAGEKFRRYAILKTYTLNELAPDTDPETVTPETTINLGSPTAAQTNLAASSNVLLNTGKHIVPIETTKEAMTEAQFFTPSTKKALEEVATSTQAQGSTAAQPSNVKRTITFGTIIEADLSQNLAKTRSVHESQTKKNKGQSKEAKHPTN